MIAAILSIPQGWASTPILSITENPTKEATVPRDGSNIYSKPAGTTAVSGTAIESAKFNSVIDDIATDLNTVRPIVAGGTGAASASAARTSLAVPGTADAATISGNWTVSGTWTITGNTKFNDSVRALFGTGSDLQIYHNGGNSFIEDTGTGALFIKGSIVQITGTSGEVLVSATAGGAAELRENGSTKLTTTTTGVTVTGLVSGDTIGGAMVSTDVSADTGSTTKVPCVDAVETAIAAASPTTLLGTITTTSGATQSLGSLSLTGYKSLRCVVDGVSFSTGAQLTFNSINVSGSTAGAATVIHGIVDLDLGTGVSVGMVGVSGSNSNVYSANTSYSTATTSITFGASSGNFDAGSIIVYGIK
jgi:hypothetical protein